MLFAAIVLKLVPVIITVSPASPIKGENEEITGSVCACAETTNEKKIIPIQINLLIDFVNKINLIFFYLEIVTFLIKIIKLNAVLYS
jgi:hypothetical protein